MRIKILILQPRILPYRKCVFEILSEKYDLTVGYVYEATSYRDYDLVAKSYAVLKIPSFDFFGLRVSGTGFLDYCTRFDVVVSYPDLHLPMFAALSLFRFPFGVIPWSIGVRASYTTLYSLTRRMCPADWVYGLALFSGDAVVVYMRQAYDFWRIKPSARKRFVAHNTVAVDCDDGAVRSSSRRSILFVGTLYREKNVALLIKAYSNCRSSCTEVPQLRIVGDGPEREALESLVRELRMGESVIFLGAIFDEARLAQEFLQALACISPDQAGLTVLKSMGYGVPFVTRRNAITGGEILNLTDRVTGVLFDSDEELGGIITEIAESPMRFVGMGVAARCYYESTASPRHMACGIIDAIESVRASRGVGNVV